MITLDPIAHALVAADSTAADALGAPNYDEFQSDREVWELLRQRPFSVLRVTMPHCDVRTPEDIGEEGSKATLGRAVANMARLMNDPMVRKAREIMWVYEITRPGHEDRSQIGLGGLALTREIRTPQNPGGTVIRNEGIREEKARGRATLTQATHTDIVRGGAPGSCEREPTVVRDARRRRQPAPHLARGGSGDDRDAARDRGARAAGLRRRRQSPERGGRHAGLHPLPRGGLPGIDDDDRAIQPAGAAA
jgi:hypothetical protein